MRYKALLFLLFLFGTCFGVGLSFWPFSKAKTPQDTQQKPGLSPVIFVPGDGGSQMQARLNKSTSPYHICQKEADWYTLWLNVEQLVIPMVTCWVDNIKLFYDNVTRTTHNTPGVTIRIPGWGDPENVEWIDPSKGKAGAYFKDIGSLLETLGYEKRKNVHGAPYDFRKAPNELGQFFIDLKKLVEDTYENNGKAPVTFITHSMGSPLTLVFFHYQTEDWKKKYIKRQISLAGAWAGSMKAVKVFAMGDDLDSIILSSRILRAEQITNPSTSWLLPNPLFWKPSEILAETPDRVYTMAQLKDFFRDIDFLTGWEMRKDSLKYTLNFNAPGVELHCLYGDGVDTVEKLSYSKKNINGETPKLIKGPGDGTVNRRSLSACRHWIGYQGANISVVSLKGVDHLGILANADALNYIKTILSNDKK